MISEMMQTGGSCRTTACKNVIPLNSSVVDMILARALKVLGFERPISYSAWIGSWNNAGKLDLRDGRQTQDVLN